MVYCLQRNASRGMWSRRRSWAEGQGENEWVTWFPLNTLDAAQAREAPVDPAGRQGSPQSMHGIRVPVVMITSGPPRALASALHVIALGEGTGILEGQWSVTVRALEALLVPCLCWART